MSPSSLGTLFTLLTLLAASMAASAGNDAAMMITSGATLVLQIAAIACFLAGSTQRPD